MGSALDSSAALDFIKKGPTTPEEVPKVPEVPVATNEAPAPAPKSEEKEPAPPPIAEAPVPESKPVLHETPRPTPDDDPLVNVNFRLPTSVAQGLLRASMERKLAKDAPYTQQDITAAALRAWLKKNKSS